MKNLKKWQQFEGLKSDFEKSKKEIEDEADRKKEQLREIYKQKVDSFMYDLTDDYGTTNKSGKYSFFPYHEDFLIYYFLSCPWSDTDKFLNEVELVKKRIESELEVRFNIHSVELKYDYDNTTSLTDQFVIRRDQDFILDSLKDYITGYKNKIHKNTIHRNISDLILTIRID
jgi:hypothetical protein